MSEVTLHLSGNNLLISFDYNETIIAKLKKIPGCRWKKALGRWQSPLVNYKKIIDSLSNVIVSTAVMERLAEEAALTRRVEALKAKSYHELDDYSPKVPLMSHQKKAFELHRMLRGSGDFSQMGCGKCRLGAENQLLNGTLIRADETWNKYAGIPVRNQDGWWASPKEKLYVSSLNSKGKIVRNKVKYLYRQQVKETLVKITLDDGSETTATKAHKFYNTDKWTNKLEVGSRVCVPRFLPEETGSLDPILANLFGWMVGEGCERAGPNCHRFSQKDKNDRKRVENIFKYINKKYKLGINVKEYLYPKDDRTPYIEVISPKFREFCESFGYIWGQKSATKQVPKAVMQANNITVKEFLKSYFDGEAHVNFKRNVIEVSSASQLLIKQVGTLLRRFGIWMRIKHKRKCATNGKRIYRDYWEGTFGGPSARIFGRQIGFTIDYKIENLKKICAIKPNSNVEGVPACSLLQEIIKRTGLPMGHIAGNYTVYFKGTQEPSRETLAIFIKNIDKILSGQKMKEMEATVAAGGQGSTRCKKSWPFYYKLDHKWLQKKRDELQNLINQEVHYAKVKKIEEIDYEGWVYDLEIEPDHNYVAENILCHNTASAICNVHWHIEMGNIENALVVCPKSVIRGWAEQIIFFSDLTFTSLTGTKPERLKKLALKKDIYLINYAGARIMRDDLLKKGFNMIICDEAHRIKNPQSKQSKACYALSDRAEWKIALTGTPVLNTALDAFGVMRFIDSTVFGESFYAFRNRYFKNVGPENSPIQIFIPQHGAEKVISDKLDTRSIRYLKEECLDLPVVSHLPNRIVSLGPDQDRAYRSLQENLAAVINENKSIKINHVLTLMLKLNQVTSGWIKDSDTGEITHFKTNPKFNAIKEAVEEAGNQSIIIWSYYKEDMKIVTNYFGRCQKCKESVNLIPDDKCPKCHTTIKYRCSEVQGSTKRRDAEIARFRFTPEERALQRKRFIDEGLKPTEIRNELGDLLPDGSEPPQSNIFAGQINAASEGLNLQVSTLSLYLSRSYSLKDYLQSLARNHRKGQTKKVTYLNVVAVMQNGDTTVDQRIVDALTKKENLSKRINKDDIKLLTGNYKKKDREAFKDIIIEEEKEELDRPRGGDDPSDDTPPEFKQKDLF